MSINLRLAMPETYAFICECREEFGIKTVNDQIRLGMEGAETFHASENGIEVGTKITPAEKFIWVEDMVVLSKEEQAEREKKRK